jgi:hypothetical protein
MAKTYGVKIVDVLGGYDVFNGARQLAQAEPSLTRAEDLAVDALQDHIARHEFKAFGRCTCGHPEDTGEPDHAPDCGFEVSADAAWYAARDEAWNRIDDCPTS